MDSASRRTGDEIWWAAVTVNRSSGADDNWVIAGDGLAEVRHLHVELAAARAEIDRLMEENEQLRSARAGTELLRETMAVRVEIDLTSDNRLFPSQDFVPQKGFGNLIALPLQGGARKQANAVFLDPATIEPWPDQWAFPGRGPATPGR